MDVIGYDVRAVASDDHAAPGLRQVDLDAVYADSDVVFVACALTPENHHLLSRPQFDAMRDGVLIVNVSRGALIDQSALVDALRSGKVAGAGLDVFEQEPLPAGRSAARLLRSLRVQHSQRVEHRRGGGADESDRRPTSSSTCLA